MKKIIAILALAIIAANAEKPEPIPVTITKPEHKMMPCKKEEGCNGKIQQQLDKCKISDNNTERTEKEIECMENVFKKNNIKAVRKDKAKKAHK
jgi:hypothetical protein